AVWAVLNHPAPRRAGGALGVAVFGAVAGEPAAQGSFLHGLHLLGFVSAGLWLAAAVLAVVTVQRVRVKRLEPTR
ncbi:hypothetical protein ACFXPA_27175, partial [Amycolatopsis sp. NPDC059090]